MLMDTAIMTLDEDWTAGHADSHEDEREEEVANPAEVLLALQSLEPAALLRLKSYARYRMRALANRAQGRTHEDLLSEAFMASLNGTRRWKPRAVTFEGHLCGIMRSLSSHWGERRPQVSLDDLHEVPRQDDPDPERELSARQQLGAIRERFAEDPLVLELMEAFGEGLKGPEIKARFGWSQTELETVVRRLRRGVEKMEGGRRHA